MDDRVEVGKVKEEILGGWCRWAVGVDNQAISDHREQTTKGLWSGEWQPQETKAQKDGPRVQRENLQLNPSGLISLWQTLVQNEEIAICLSVCQSLI